VLADTLADFPGGLGDLPGTPLDPGIEVEVRCRDARLLAEYLKEIAKISFEVGVLDTTLYRDDLANRSERPALRETVMPVEVDDRIVVLVDDVVKSGRTIRAAMDALTQVTRRYPQTDYARDARLKIDLTLDHLAGKEMDIGRWYLRQGHDLAAINRFKRVVEEYQTTSHVPEALHRLVEAYVALGILDEAREVAAVLGYNYPGSVWYEDTYDLLADQGMVDRRSGAELEDEGPEGRSWWGRTVGRVF